MPVVIRELVRSWGETVLAPEHLRRAIRAWTEAKARRAIENVDVRVVSVIVEELVNIGWHNVVLVDQPQQMACDVTDLRLRLHA